MRLKLTALMLILGLLGQPAQAQFFRYFNRAPKPAPAPQGCVFDHCDPVGTPAATPTPLQPSAQPPAGGSAIAPGQFDFYVLSLSWSPGFCDTNSAGNGRDQCAAGAGMGFVVHGLWPQNEHGYPSNCSGDVAVPRAALNPVRGLYPADALARYEWRKHGTCTGKSAYGYFADVARARAMVAIPALLQAPHQAQQVAPVEIMRAFTAANPNLRPGMMAVACSRSELTEVRLCLTKDLRGFRACNEVMRQSCHTPHITIAAER